MSHVLRYSVEEIDELRKVIRQRYLFGTSLQVSSKIGLSRMYRECEVEKVIEEVVRTHMLAGHIALDILKADGYVDGYVVEEK